MISYKKLEEQMQRINFHYKGWGRSEVEELCNILMPEEEIEECVNGWYEAGFALLVATKGRLLLVDKKPLKYLTVEDFRFDMINEFDLHHRLIGAQIRVSAGNKTLHFTSLNQARLRRLLGYVQARMTQMKNDDAQQQEAQKKHLEEMNEQLRLYLMAAHKQQFIDQANAINQGVPQLAPIQAPAAALVYPQAVPVQQTAQPQNSFEQVAAAAFHGTRTETDQQAEFPVQQTAQPPVSHAEEKHKDDATLQQIGLAAVRRVVPVITGYTRMPLMRERRPIPRADRSASADLA